MIISASRRTDIPAFFSDWFINRIQEGFVLVKNPMNPRQISRVSLAREDVDGIVFWTKNPIPMIDKLKYLNDIPYYFQFTLNPYGTDIEPNVPSKNDAIIPAFLKLSEKLGPDRIIWRYDPIILSAKYTIEYHIEYFEKLARRLRGSSHMCTFSFLDIYRNTQKNLASIAPLEISHDDMETIADAFSKIAHAYDFKLSTCAESIELDKYGISHAKCIDPNIFEQITGMHYKHSKDPNQRPECGCAPSVDIGAYNCCLNGCLYCYANYNKAIVPANSAQHDPKSPILIGEIAADVRITQRKNVSSIIL
ncbi:MAG: DUF1848 domain-containing protein [Clostridia bacterium]|nr:DUF1848 domain-containing protein [Clostridia bacterium]